MSEPHDAVVVGGGPAGLAAALWLARYRRDVVVVDSGAYRAARVERSHGYLGRDPQRPLELLAAGRSELGAYPTAGHRQGEVRRLARDGGAFRLELADGDVLRALRVVLATGVVDELPDVEGMADHLGASAFHCPACDGYEAAGRDVVALGWDRRLVGFATSLLDWAGTVRLVTAGRRFRGDRSCRAELARDGIPIHEQRAAALVGERGRLRAVRLDDGTELAASLVFFSVAHRPRTELATALGAAVDRDGYLRVDRRGQTTVPGLYAAGDVAPGLQLVAVATAQGVTAGVAAAESLHGEPGSRRSPRPAPAVPAEVVGESDGDGHGPGRRVPSAAGFCHHPG